MSAEPVIGHVSDTARWVAMYRALESERPDAIFRDPYARRLAGPKGEDILARMPKARRMAWPMIVRTAVMDEIITRTLPQLDAIVNLAAGLDTRPWRMDLPADLRWYDVDLPAMEAYKRKSLAGETPRCRLESVPLDLSDADARRAFLDRLGGETRRALVITEGLLVYLTPENVADLARDLHAVPSCWHWMTDLANPTLARMLGKTWDKQLQAGQAPFRFFPEESTGFFEPFGWREVEWRQTFADSIRLNRSIPFAKVFRWIGETFWSAKRRAEMHRAGGIAVLERVEVT